MDEIITRSVLGPAQSERGRFVLLSMGVERRHIETSERKPKKGSGVGVTSVEGEGERIERTAAVYAIRGRTRSESKRLEWRHGGAM